MEGSGGKSALCRDFVAASSSTRAVTMCNMDWLLNGESGAAVGVGEVATPAFIAWRSGYGLVARGELDLLADLRSVVSALRPLNSGGRAFVEAPVVRAPAQDQIARVTVEGLAEFDALAEYLVEYWLRRGSELLLG